MWTKAASSSLDIGLGFVLFRTWHYRHGQEKSVNGKMHVNKVIKVTSRSSVRRAAVVCCHDKSPPTVITVSTANMCPWLPERTQVGRLPCSFFESCLMYVMYDHYMLLLSKCVARLLSKCAARIYIIFIYYKYEICSTCLTKWTE